MTLDPQKLAELRVSYARHTLDENQAPDTPYPLFEAWLAEAITAQLPEPNAMTLATASVDGRPSARIVLLKDYSAGNLVFYTNYESRKGQELATNPQAAVAFWWAELERQVRVEGRIVQLSAEESLHYYRSRPPGSKIGAWASPQSRPVASRKVLEDLWAKYENEFGRTDIPLPPFWGGYRLLPDYFEFWQGRSNRMHDRLVYSLAQGHWQLQRLAP